MQLVKKKRQFNVWMIIAIVLLFLIVLFGIYKLKHDDKVTAVFSFLFVIGVVAYLLWEQTSLKKIPFPIQKQHYIRLMEEKEHISIDKFAQVYQLTEEGDRYVFILQDYIDARPHYYMCEASMYEEASFGRGFGQWTTKIAEAQYWYQTRQKYNVQQILAEELQRQALNRLMIDQQRQLKMQQAAMANDKSESEWK